MKPCKSCPFNRESLPGLWGAAHYLGIAYLMSIDHASVIGQSMGCHQWNGTVNEKLAAEESPICGGWMRAARDTLAMRLKFVTNRVDPEEAYDGYPVMDPEEMMEVNGFDMDLIPPLKWDRTSEDHLDRYPTYEDWEAAVLNLRYAVNQDPRFAETFVLPGSPLDVGVDREQVAEFMGEDVAEAYFGDEERLTC